MPVRLQNHTKNQKLIEYPVGPAPTDAAVKAHAAKQGVSHKVARRQLDDREIRTLQLGGMDSTHADWPPTVVVDDDTWAVLKALPTMRQPDPKKTQGWLDKQEITADMGVAA